MHELIEFSLDTENGEKNYNLAQWYEKLGHTAPAHTYYLRAAERTEDSVLAYRGLIRASFCYKSQGSRDGTEKVLLENALMLLPERPEAYYFLSLLYEKKGDWQGAYIYANLGLQCYKQDIDAIDLPEYQGKHLLMFQKAVSAWWWGKGHESKDLFKVLFDEYYHMMSDKHQKLIEENMDKLGIGRKKIIDCFRFFNEKELLELRYKLLHDKVDKFVVLEGTKTFSGNDWKPLAKEYVKELNLPEEKFIFVQSNLPSNDEDVENTEVDIIFRSFSAKSNDSYKNSLNARTRERLVLDGLLSVISQFADRDIFFVSDCDEIIKPEYVNYFANVASNYQNKLIKIPLVELQGRANLRAYYSDTNTPIPTDNVFFVCTKKHFEKATPTQMRYNIQNPFETVYLTEDGTRLEECGWHFTWMGDANRMKLKIKSTAHYADHIESAIIPDMNSENLDKFIDNWKPESDGINPWGNRGFILREYSLDNLPKQIFESDTIKKFLLAQEDKQMSTDNTSILVLDREKINQIDVSYLGEYCLKKEEIGGLSGECGRESYKLYTFLSTQVNDSIILDIGSCYGNSAIALSYNESNHVISYDLQDLGAPSIQKENITWKIMDFMNDESIDYSKVKMILIDVDPHDGKQEFVMKKFLYDKGWSGLLLLDDIHLNPNMEFFWNSFPENERYDLTHLGHWSGTGLIKFNF